MSYPELTNFSRGFQRVVKPLYRRDSPTRRDLRDFRKKLEVLQVLSIQDLNLVAQRLTETDLWDRSRWETIFLARGVEEKRRQIVLALSPKKK